MWAFNFFFYNKKMKRILYIGVKALSKTAAEEEEKVGHRLGAVEAAGHACIVVRRVWLQQISRTCWAFQACNSADTVQQRHQLCHGCVTHLGTRRWL